MTTMKAAVVHDFHQPLRIEELPKPELLPQSPELRLYQRRKWTCYQSRRPQRL
jgi:hypothetical protein